MRAILARLSARRRVRVAGASLALLVLAAVGAPVLEALLGVRHDVPDLMLRRCAPGYPHLLGCDELGQDLLARLLFGARISVAVGFAASMLSAGIGTLVGVVSGARGGRVDALLMRIVDAMLAIPMLPLLLLTSAMSIGAEGAHGHGQDSAFPMIALLGGFGWMNVARVARAETLRVVQLEFVVAAKALGAPLRHVFVSHLLPHALPSVLVAATIDVGRNILAEAALSFLGLGVQPPTPSWGNMLRHAEDAVHSDPGLAFWPGSCILLSVVCVTVLGEALRDAVNPRAARLRSEVA